MLHAPSAEINILQQKPAPQSLCTGPSPRCRLHQQQQRSPAVQVRQPELSSSNSSRSSRGQSVVRRAATLDRPETSVAAESQHVGFHTGEDGWLYCDGSKIDDIRQQVKSSPFYLYSKSKLKHNYAAYADALRDIPAIIGYAIKANNNLHILKELSQSGSGAVLVSGNELQLAMAAGFDASR